MPSNKNLIKEANEIASELNIPINTDGLKNADLAELVSDLKAKKTDAETDTQADTAEAVAMPAPVAAVAPEPVAKRVPFSVAAGKALTTKRGVLGEGVEIKVEDVTGGKETIDSLVKSGYVVEAE